MAGDRNYYRKLASYMSEATTYTLTAAKPSANHYGKRFFEV